MYYCRRYSGLQKRFIVVSINFCHFFHLQKYYDEFHGFVVLHGTDTLSYTASALSYLLENLGKTVIVTGSQIPIFETRTDGVENFTSSLIIAANHNIPEVCIFFNLQLFRGNRSTKVSCEELSAFSCEYLNI